MTLEKIALLPLFLSFSGYADVVRAMRKVQHAHVRNGFLTALTSSKTVINTHSTNNPVISHKYRVKSKNQEDLIIDNSL